MSQDPDLIPSCHYSNPPQPPVNIHPEPGREGMTNAVQGIGILTYISEAAIVLCSLSKERLCSVRRAMEGTEPSTRSDQPRNRTTASYKPQSQTMIPCLHWVLLFAPNASLGIIAAAAQDPNSGMGNQTPLGLTRFRVMFPNADLRVRVLLLRGTVISPKQYTRYFRQ